MSRPVLGFVGAGKVGQALARLWSERGYRVGAVASRSSAHARALASQVGAEAVPVGEVSQHADLILLTVPDDQIEPVANSLANQNAARGRGFLHTSGAHDATVLGALAAAGAQVGSLHPAFPFADVETAHKALPGATFAVEAESARLRDWATELVDSADGRLLMVPPGQKALYHAALVLASNYTVTLYALAERLLTDLGAERATADAALDALVGGTVANLRAQGVPDALTGPLVRGDVGTIGAHVEALTHYEPRLAQLYLELAQLSLPLLEARGIDSAPIAACLGGFAAHQE
jgi:predicted short-subunit dehydrogenase-like oxidoreductase (DUF2520 family)